MKVRLIASIGDESARRENIIEMPDSASDEELDKEALEFAVNNIDCWWEKVADE